MQSACRRVESRCAINIVMASRLTATSEWLDDLFLVKEFKTTSSICRNNAMRHGAEERARSRADAFLTPETSPASQSFESSRGCLSEQPSTSGLGVRLQGILRPWRPGARIAGSRERSENSCVSCGRIRFSRKYYLATRVLGKVFFFRYRRYGHSSGGKADEQSFTKTSAPRTGPQRDALARATRNEISIKAG